MTYLQGRSATDIFQSRNTPAATINIATVRHLDRVDERHSQPPARRTASHRAALIAVTAAVAAGACAIGVMVIGLLAIRRLRIERADIKTLTIDELHVDKLRARDVAVTGSIALPE
jgi:hypothetical protein